MPRCSCSTTTATTPRSSCTASQASSRCARGWLRWSAIDTGPRHRAGSSCPPSARRRQCSSGTRSPAPRSACPPTARASSASAATPRGASCRASPSRPIRVRAASSSSVDLAETVLWYCRLGDDRWRKHEYEYEFTAVGAATLSAVLRSMSRLTSVGGKFFADHLDDMVVMLEFSPEPVFTAIPKDKNISIWPPCNGAYTVELVESHGDLFSVRFNRSSYLQERFVVGVGVFKLDLSAQAWVKAESLGDRAFIIHKRFGGSWDPKEDDGLKGDCVYYCLPNDKGLYVYDMGRGTTALRNPDSNLGDPCSTKAMFRFPTIHYSFQLFTIHSNFSLFPPHKTRFPANATVFFLCYSVFSYNLNTP
ncbi:hypothetical protein HU200_042218 [Digitaria exilis]|uniref:KIB1-4 beta-propeller domain-containing protein n=1 Tax=Digitaria exilis TaxID=1010633 RepID=A0A835B563_9POAL|nr:hypothetical protein HU200_042218 [Digitaria exilis]